MKKIIPFLLVFAWIQLVQGAGSENRKLEAETFELTSFEKKTYPDGTRTYGIFKFRYKGPEPLMFFGFEKPVGSRFETEFTQYQIEKKGKWQDLEIGYCGTGAETFPLLPGKDYKFRVDLTFKK